MCKQYELSLVYHIDTVEKQQIMVLNTSHPWQEFAIKGSDKRLYVWEPDREIQVKWSATETKRTGFPIDSAYENASQEVPVQLTIILVQNK